MNLNKQLQKVVLGEDENGKKFTLGIPETENETKICVEIAEKFTIDFAEWIFINYPNQYKIYQYKDERGFYSTKKLLEMYKKTLE